MSRIVDSYLSSEKEERYKSYRLAFFSESVANARVDSKLMRGKLIHQSGRKRTLL